MIEVAELSAVLSKEVNTVLCTVLHLYSDGGPDHRTMYVSVQAALLALFPQHNLDFLVAAYTAPMSSYRNTAELAMALLNLALQGIHVIDMCHAHGLLMVDVL